MLACAEMMLACAKQWKTIKTKLNPFGKGWTFGEKNQGIKPLASQEEFEALEGREEDDG
jgi:hypothetical protein